MDSPVQASGIPPNMATGPYTASLPEIDHKDSDTESQAVSGQQPIQFQKSESKSLGFAGKTRDMFTGKKAVSTIMTLGFLFTWSERVMTYFRTGFSLYRDTPQMITGRNLEGNDRLAPIKTGSENIKKLFIKGSDNSFSSTYSTGEKIEAAATIGGVVQNLWFLFSSREGDIPEGDTILQRIKHTFKDPKHHVAQITSLWMTLVVGLVSIGRVMIGVENLSKDASGQNIGFSPRKVLSGLDGISKIEKLMPLVAGTALLISTPLNIYGFMNIKKPTSPSTVSKDDSKIALAQQTTGNIALSGDANDSHLKPFAKSQSDIHQGGIKDMLTMLSPGNIKDVIQYAKKNDPIGLTGRILAFALDVGSFGVGMARLKEIESGKYVHKYGAANTPQWNSARALAKQTRNIGILGFALTGLYSMYVYDTVMQSYKKEQQAIKAGNNNAQVAR